MSAKFHIDITANAKGFGDVVSKARAQLNHHLGGEILGKFGGILGVAGLEQAAHRTIEFASRFNDASKKLGVGVEFLQEASFAAKQTGADFSDVETSLKRLQIATAGALGPNGATQQNAFARLGVSMGDLQSKNTEQIFRQIASYIEKAAPSSRIMADAVLTMGRGADRLLPAFREGFNAAGEQARQLGLIMSSEVIEKLDKIGDNLNIVSTKFKVAFGPFLVTMVDAAASALDKLNSKLGFASRIAGRASTSNKLPGLGDFLLDFVLGGTKRTGGKMTDALTDALISEVADTLLSGGTGGTKSGGVNPVATVPELQKQQSGSVMVFPRDQLSQLGLFISAGGAANQATLIGVQRESLLELKDIKQKLDTLPEDIAEAE